MKKNISSIRFEKEYLDELVKEENSCVEVKEQNYHLALHPFHLTNINESIKDILNKGIAKYDKKLDGILLGYSNIKLLSESGTVANDSFFIHVNIIASFYIFKPQIGKVLHGIVNKQSEDHVGCLVHRTFNVSLPKPEEDDDWIGLKAEIGNEITFCISFINLDGRLPYIRAEFMSIVTEEDSGFSTSEETSNNKNKKPKKIIFNSEDEQEVDLNESENKKKKKKKQSKESKEKEEDDAEKAIKKRKRKHSTNNEEEIEENGVEEQTKKRKRKHSSNNECIEELNTIRDKNKKQKHQDESYNETINEISMETSSVKKKSKKQKNIESDQQDESLEELTNAVLQRTLLSFSQDSKKEKKKHKKDKNKSNEWENDDLNSTLPELNLNSLFEENHKNKLAASDNFVMADNEDKKPRKHRTSVTVADNSIENNIDLLADSDLERVCKDVEKSERKKYSDKKSPKKRRKSTSSDEFEMPKKKVRNIQ